jgi:4-hydroxybenzoate polyprenyltransferase
VFNLKSNTEYSFINALLIAVSAALLCKETFIVAQINYSGAALYLLTFLATFIAYLNSGIEKKIAHFSFKSTTNSIAFFGVGLIFLAGLYLLVDSNITVILTMIISLSLLYFEAFERNRYFSIRKIYFAKSIVLGLVWSLTTVALPVAFAKASLFSIDILFIFLRRLVFIAALSLSFDIRDIEKDNQLGYKNIAALIGIQKTKVLSFLLLGIFIALVLMQTQAGSLTKNAARAMFVSIGISIIPIAVYNPYKKSNLVLFVIDTMLIVQFLLIYIFNNY